MNLSSEEGKKYRKHIVFDQLPVEAKINWDNKFKLGSIRNPWAWYVSLWSYGCAGKGSFYHSNTQMKWKTFLPFRNFNYFLIPRNKWKKVYADVNSKENFKAWLKLVLSDKRKKDFLEYGISPISKYYGFYTFRYFRIYWKEFKKAEKLIHSISSINQIDKDYNVVDKMIYQENLNEELLQFLKSKNYPINQDILQLSTERTNQSIHKNYKYYHDQETISWINDKEKYLIEKYNYQDIMTPKTI